MLIRRYQILIQVSLGYPCVWGRLPTRYSPVRRFPRFHSTEVSFQRFSLDLHVLGTPPAFILSQDQTLNQFYPIARLLHAFRIKFELALCLNRFRVSFRFREMIVFSRNCT